MEKKVLITAEYGLHARPATRIVNLAMGLDSTIYLAFNGKTVNLKSIMGVMSLGLYKGSLVSLIVTDGNEKKSMDELIAFLDSTGIGKEVNE